MGFRELAARLPEWGRLFDEAGHAAFLEAVRATLSGRGQPFELHEDYARLLGPGPQWDLPLLPLAHRCSGTTPTAWQERVGEEIEQRVSVEKLGREMDEIRGNFGRAKARLKLRVQPAATLGANAVSAPIAGGLHAVLVLDLPSFITPVRPADLASWEKPAELLVRLALDNVKTQEHVELKPMEVAGVRVFAVSGKGIFVASLALAADDLLGPPTPYGALIAMPSAHILLAHSLTDKRSLQALEAMAAGALQAFEGGPDPLSPHLFWKRGDRFVALEVGREEGRITCSLVKEFDDQVVKQLRAPLR